MNNAQSPLSAYKCIINPSFLLKRQGNYHFIEESKKEASNRLLKIQASKSIGFSLDRCGNRWDFFSYNTLPRGIASVSDGIIFCEANGKYYVIIIDMKSNNISNGVSQIRSSFVFCQWLNNLIHVHQASIGFKCEFIGIICLKGRDTPTKKGTRKGIEPESKRECDGNLIFTVKNPGIISINDIVRWVE